MGGIEVITEEAILDIAREAIYTIIITAAPMLLVSLIIGLIVSIFQTVTSIQEQTLTFVPKILGVFVTLMIGGSWFLNNLSGFMEELWSNIGYYISLGI
jgi:flagellar biosynthetic protein FliQ